MSASLTLPAADPKPADRLVTLPPWPWGPGDPDAPRTIGWHAIAWAEGWHPCGFPGLIQPNGPKAGQNLRFVGSQRDFLLWWYAVDDDGRWTFRHGVRRLMKNAGKSPFAAVWALIELCGPCRLDTFSIDWRDDNQPGRVRARQVDMPLVQIAATAEAQALTNTMRQVRAFAGKKSPIVEFYGLDPGKTRYELQPVGRLEVITSSSASVEGAPTTAAVFDETWLWDASNGGVDLAAALRDNLAKTDGRALETTNAFIPGRDSVAEGSWNAWLAQEEGRTRGETRILYDARIAPPDTDLTDRASLEAGLEVVKGDCWWIDLRPVIERIWDPSARPDDSKRKYLNWTVGVADAWVELPEWEALARPDIEVGSGDEVVLFFDGSKSRDATALVGCRVEDGHVFTLGVWEPGRDSAETVDVEDVDGAVLRAFERYDVRAFFADVKEWESYAYDVWPNRWRDDLDVWAVPSGRPPQPVAWDMRSHKDEFAKAVEACHADIVDGAFTHDGDSATARHVSNARRRPYRAMVSIGKESKDSPRKIDAAVCVVGARMVRRLVLGAGKGKKKSGKVWW